MASPPLAVVTEAASWPVFTTLSHNITLHQIVTMFRIVEWHYNCALKGRLDDGFTGPSRSGIDVQSLVIGPARRMGEAMSRSGINVQSLVIGRIL